MTTLEANRDRAGIYGTLARMFRPPDHVNGLCDRELSDVREALRRLNADAETLSALERLKTTLRQTDPDELAESYQNTFEASGGLRCPPNETAHTADTPQHAMVKNFELADIAGFYRAFGVEVEPGTERPDHIAAQLEFMHLLAVKEIVAEQKGGRDEQAQICRDAQRAFLRDHLGRWSGRLAARLDTTADGPFYPAAGRLLDRFVFLDAERIDAKA